MTEIPKIGDYIVNGHSSNIRGVVSLTSDLRMFYEDGGSDYISNIGRPLLCMSKTEFEQFSVSKNLRQQERTVAAREKARVLNSLESEKTLTDLKIYDISFVDDGTRVNQIVMEIKDV